MKYGEKHVLASVSGNIIVVYREIHVGTIATGINVK